MSEFEHHDLAIPREATPAEIDWCRWGLLRRTRVSTLITESPEGEAHSTVLFAPVTQQLKAVSELRDMHAVWLSSDEKSRHCTNIAAAKDRASEVGGLSGARVAINMYDSRGKRPALKLYADARRLSDEEAAKVLPIYNSLKTTRPSWLREKPGTLEPDNPGAPRKAMYAARIVTAMMTVQKLYSDDSYGGEGHTDVLDQLDGFERSTGTSWLRRELPWMVVRGIRRLF